MKLYAFNNSIYNALQSRYAVLDTFARNPKLGDIHM